MAAASDGAIDFSPLIERALDGYIPREAIEQELRASAEAGGRCSVVVGEPGSGKTALAAKLVRSTSCLHQFLSAEHADVTIWNDPYAFLASIGFQLKARYGDAVFPRSVELDVDGRVRNLDREGSYVGAHVRRLVAVPWHSANVRVRLDAKGVRGGAVGVRIDEVIEEYRAVPLSAFRQMALFDPLLELARLHPDETVALVVDGLTDPMSPDTAPTIAGVLPHPSDLREIGNLALVIFSRPGRHLDTFLNGSSALDIGDSRFADANEAVVRAFVQRELVDADVRAGLGLADGGKDTLGEEIVTRADGNFLYLRHFFLAVREGRGPELLQGGLPDGLDSVYARIVGTLVTRLGADRYLERVHPLVSTLAVAREPLDRDQMERFSGLSEAHVKSALGALAAFLDRRGPPIATTYSLYHGSFREFLLDPQQREADWHVDEPAANARIGHAYLSAEALSDVDDYGLAHLSQHLARGDREARERLIGLVVEPWRVLKRRRQHSNWSFAADVGLAADVARDQPFPAAVAQTAGLTMMRSILEDVVEQLPPRALDVMVRVGQLQRALDYVAATADAGSTAGRIREVARGLQTAGNEGLPLLISAVRAGLTRLRADPQSGLGLATVLEACPVSDVPAMADLVKEAMEVFDHSERGWWTPRAGAEIARLLGPFHHDLATQWFTQSLRSSVDMLTSSLWLEIARIFTYWAAFDPDEAARQVETVSWAATQESAEALLAVAATRNEGGHASLVRSVEEQLVPALEKPDDRAHTLLRLAEDHHGHGDDDAAVDRLARALDAIDRIGAADDPYADHSDRKAYVTTALAAAAVTASAVEPGRVEEILRRAWASLEAAGARDKERCFEDLVRAQLAVSRDLLTARTEALGSHDTKAAIMLATAAEFAAQDPTAASDLLEEALIAQEQQARGWEQYVRLELARWFDPADREETAAWLAEPGLEAGNLVAWRLDVLERLSDSASDWLRDTIEIWTADDVSLHRISDLPIAVSRLPEVQLAQVSAALEGLESPVHRALLAAAVGARVASRDPVDAERLHDFAVRAAASMPRGTPSTEIPRYLVLAFVAGQRAAVDFGAAHALLGRALLEIDGDPALEDPSRRMIFLVYALEKAMLGSVGLALPHLVAAREPPLPPNTLRLVAPGPGVEPLSLAGMSDRDRLLAIALGRSEPGSPAVQEYLATATPAVRALALVEAARSALPLDTRLGWAEEAAAAAADVAEPGLACLLLCAAAGAFGEIGVRRREQELAHAAAVRAVAGIGVRGGILQMSCAHALGQALERLEGQAEVLRLLWQAADLGTDELAVVVGHLPTRLVANDTAFAGRLRDALRDAAELFTTSGGAAQPRPSGVLVR